MVSQPAAPLNGASMLERDAIVGILHNVFDTITQSMNAIIESDDLDHKITLALNVGRLGAATRVILECFGVKKWETFQRKDPNRTSTRGQYSCSLTEIRDAISQLLKHTATADRPSWGRYLCDAEAILSGAQEVPRGGTRLAYIDPALIGSISLAPEPTNLDRLPNRPDNLEYRPVPSRSFKALSETHEGRGQLIFSMMLDIEISACEICSLMALSYPTLGDEFVLDMAQQVHDEGRHAAMMMAHYRAIGFSLGDHREYTAHAFRKWRVASDLAQRLAIQNVLQEGNALDNIVFLSGAFRQAGDDDFADILKEIEPDETYHCHLGIKWLERLGYEQPGLMTGLLDVVAEKIGAAFPGAYPINQSGRRSAGFNDTVIAILLERQRRVGMI